MKLREFDIIDGDRIIPAEWLHDIGAAADELGYGIELIEPSHIRLSDRGYTLDIDTHFLSGDTLRALLKSRKGTPCTPA
jgi:hypothetical protein